MNSHRKVKSGKTINSLLYMRDCKQNIGSPLQQQLRARRLMSDRFSASRRDGYLYGASLIGHFGCVNAIEFSNKGGQFLVSGGDDRRILLWNLEKELSSYDPIKGKKLQSNCVMRGEHNSNIFCLAFDMNNDKIFSGGNDDQVIIHDAKTQETVDVFTHEDAVYGISTSPCDPNNFVSACADGRVLIWDLRASTQDPFVLSNYTSPFHAVCYHPLEPRFLATANAKEGVALWDIRMPRTCLMRYGSAYTQLNAMSVRFNMFGNQLLALRRRLPPVIYSVDKATAFYEFDHSGYYNSCTMKSCCFAGDRDQYILSGSDDFNVFMWKVPEAVEEQENNFVGEAALVLTGHRQIVNQVRFNYSRNIIASSGVEKIIKLWSPFQMPGMLGRLDNNRKMYTHQQYFELMINSNSTLSHDYSQQSTDEDPQMLAFFDSLIQREVDRSFSSESDDSELSPASLYFHFAADSDDNSNHSNSPQPVQVPPISDDSEEDAPLTYINLHSKNSRPLHQNSLKQADEKASLSNIRESAAFSEALDGMAKPGPSQESKKTVSRDESSSSSNESTESDESEDFYIMQFKNKFFKRISQQRKKHKQFGVLDKKIGFKISKAPEEKDRLTNLKQRAAFCQVLMERIPCSSSDDEDSDSAPPQINEEEFRTLSDQLNQRTEGARQRGAALRVKRLQIASDTLNPATSFRIRGHDNERTDKGQNDSHVNGHECSTTASHSVPQGFSHNLAISNSHDSSDNVIPHEPRTSECNSTSISSVSPRVNCEMSETVEPKDQGDLNGNLGETSNEGFSGFKKMKKGTKRKYRSHGENHERKESDSD